MLHGITSPIANFAALSCIVFATLAAAQNSNEVNCPTPQKCAELAVERVFELDRRYAAIVADLRAQLESARQTVSDLEAASSASLVDLTAKVDGRAEVPTKLVGYFAAQNCPDGWRRYDRANGRYLVGADNGSLVEQNVGKALSAKENRTVGNHTHQTSQEVFTGGSNGPGSCGNGFRRKIVSTDGPIVATGESTAKGTNAPYFYLLACEKT